MKYLASVLLFVFFHFSGFAQELFPMTEPASNMATDALGLRLGTNNYQSNNFKIKSQLKSEVMYGINARWMIHFNGYFSDFYSKAILFQGVGTYFKYRFLSMDSEHRHTRMAAFGRITYNPTKNYTTDLNIEGAQSGAAVGLVITQLLHKLALSVTLNETKAFSSTGINPENSFNYNLSAGYLIYPKKYTNYRQTNCNLYVEAMGKSITSNPENNFAAGASLDIVPSIQFIFNSQTRLDISYKRSIYNTIVYNAHQSIMVKVEHNIFNAFRNRK